MDLLEEEGGRPRDEGGGDGRARHQGRLVFPRVGGADDVLPGRPEVDALAVVGRGGLVVEALGVVLQGADGDRALMVGAVEARVICAATRTMMRVNTSSVRNIVRKPSRRFPNLFVAPGLA